MLIRLIPSRFQFLIIMILGFSAAVSKAYAGTPLTVEQIILKVAEKNGERSANLKGYSSTRTYQLHYRGFFGSRDAEMIVEARFTAPATKEFHVVNESGSKFIINHILRNLLTTEQDAMNAQNQQETALTLDNYDFKLEREESESNHRYYILQARPKRKNKLLFRGYVWIDADDFALVRVDAEPAKNPSFWISKTNIQHRYTKVDEFWLPSLNVSKTNVRLGGVATLTINYGAYVVSTRPNSDSNPRQALGLSIGADRQILAKRLESQIGKVAD